MISDDPFSQQYAELLDDTYDVVDRIVLTAYFRLAQSPGGLRFWWRQWNESDENLDDTHLMRLAGRFSRRVRGWAKKNGIPVIYCKAGERKHLIADEHSGQHPCRRRRHQQTEDARRDVRGRRLGRCTGWFLCGGPRREGSRAQSRAPQVLHVETGRL